jgi:hypothetical protein
MTERWSAVERTGDSVVAEGLTAQIGPRTADAIGRRIVGPFTRA